MQRFGGLQAMIAQAPLGIQLALRGKMSPFPEKINNPLPPNTPTIPVVASTPPPKNSTSPPESS